MTALPAPPSDPKREARVRLLRDLVANGLYRVKTDAVADRLIDALLPERNGRR